MVVDTGTTAELEVSSAKTLVVDTEELLVSLALKFVVTPGLPTVVVGTGTTAELEVSSAKTLVVDTEE